jgi:2-amino-4-hydroxy-6-hydroxymethyldihydropteridine diphosphokinase
MKEITISLGSNINPIFNLQEASELIIKNFTHIKSSKIYSSKSEGFQGDDFLNQVILCNTELEFEKAIHSLKKIEISMGRKKELKKFSDRLIDLDLLTYGDEILKKNGQEVPHKDIEKYPFVLVPLAEICPEKIHPINKISFNKALRKSFKKEIDEKNLFYPDLSRCTDNGAMIAFAASEKLNLQRDHEIKVNPRWSLEEIDYG